MVVAMSRCTLFGLNLTHALALAKFSRRPLVALRIRTPSFAQAIPLAFFDGGGLLFDSLSLTHSANPSLTVTVFVGQCQHSVRRKRSSQRRRTPTRIRCSRRASGKKAIYALKSQ
ncbi:hypothetical protein C8F01DRAFT_1152705 [Mycena amicta]|nr:hypothetical protein C8F01DRAFT_1152705 [Mycena amicta]